MMVRQAMKASEDFLANSIKAETLLGYLAIRGVLTSTIHGASVRELGGGISNRVWLVEAGERRLVVKQSLEKLRVNDDWRSDRSRIFCEVEAIQALRPCLQHSVPEILHIDYQNYLYVMTAAPPFSVLWKDSLLAGNIEVSVARAVGSMLARIINPVRSDPIRQEEMRRRFDDRTVFDQLRVDPYYRTTASRVPAVAVEITSLIEDSWRIRTSLVHGDYSPKNILVHDGCIFLIDFEVVHWGDPAFDSAFLLNHLFLKAFHRPRSLEFYLEAVDKFWRALLAGLHLQPQPEGEFERMTIRHLGALMLARIDGKSPVEYIRDDRTKDLVRATAKRILLEHPERMSDAICVISPAIAKIS